MCHWVFFPLWGALNFLVVPLPLNVPPPRDNEGWPLGKGWRLGVNVVFLRDLTASIWSLACWSNVLPNSNGAASRKVSSSSIKVPNSGLRWVVALRRCTVEMLAEALLSSFSANWADSAALLGVRDPFLADSKVLRRGAAASSTRVCSLARLWLVSLAGVGSLDWMVGFSFGHFVKGVSGIGCLRFKLQRLSLEIECPKASSTIFIVVDDSFSVPDSWSSESPSSSQKTCSL